MAAPLPCLCGSVSNVSQCTGCHAWKCKSVDCWGESKRNGYPYKTCVKCRQNKRHPRVNALQQIRTSQIMMLDALVGVSRELNAAHSTIILPALKAPVLDPPIESFALAPSKKRRRASDREDVLPTLRPTPRQSYRAATAVEMQQWRTRPWVYSDKTGQRLSIADVYKCAGLIHGLEFVWVSICPVRSYLHAWNTPLARILPEQSTVPVFMDGTLLPQLMKVVRLSLKKNGHDRDTVTVEARQTVQEWAYAEWHHLDKCPTGGEMNGEQGVWWVECPWATQPLTAQTCQSVKSGTAYTLAINSRAIEDDDDEVEKQHYTSEDVVADGPVWNDEMNKVSAKMVITFDHVKSSHQMQRLAMESAYRKKVTGVLLHNSVLQGVTALAQLALSYLENPFVATDYNPFVATD